MDIIDYKILTIEECAKLMEKSDKGDVVAKFRIACAYEYGWVLLPDSNKAKHYFEQIALGACSRGGDIAKLYEDREVWCVENLSLRKIIDLYEKGDKKDSAQLDIFISVLSKRSDFAWKKWMAGKTAGWKENEREKK